MEIEESDFINHSNQYSEFSVLWHLFAVWFGSRYRHIYFNRSPRMGAQSKCIICSPAEEALIDISSFVSLKSVSQFFCIHSLSSHLSYHHMTQQRLSDVNVPMKGIVVFDHSGNVLFS